LLVTEPIIYEYDQKTIGSIRFRPAYRINRRRDRYKEDDTVITEKIKQAAGILKEEGVDLWLTFVRESEVTPDPALDLILGVNCTWQSAFIITSKGEATALVGSLDESRIKGTGGYEVIGYTKSIKEALVEQLKRRDSKTIAINFSMNDLMADGLSHGMYMILTGYLEGTPYLDRLVSSEKIMAKLRGRKSPEELRRITRAVDMAEEIFSLVTGFVKPGMTEKEVASFIMEEVDRRGVGTAWEQETCPAVFTGPESAGAHAGPTDRKIEKGHVLNIDFGVNVEEYCSDLQRTWYFLKDGETKAPEIVQKAFDTVRDAIALSAERIRPGMEGREVDSMARDHITGQGFGEYPHALGHQIGRKAHDGGTLLCPEWERYGDLPYMKVEEGQTFTLEPRIILPGYGVATIEEIIVVRPDGGEFLSKKQTEIFLI
jgi:Xaa-Pro aminopeptidase